MGNSETSWQLRHRPRFQEQPAMGFQHAEHSGLSTPSRMTIYVLPCWIASDGLPGMACPSVGEGGQAARIRPDVVT